jgi:hypothetical protein
MRFCEMLTVITSQEHTEKDEVDACGRVCVEGPIAPHLSVWILLKSGISYSPNTPLENPTTSKLVGEWKAAHITSGRQNRG